MFKKLCLAATVALCTTLSAEITNEPKLEGSRTDSCIISPSLRRKIELSTTLDHIAEEKTAIMLKTKTALILMQRGTTYFQQTLAEQYISTQQACLQLLRSMTASTEFITTLDQVTDEQAILIVDQMVKFNDIIIDPTVYPLEKKLNEEIALAAFDEQTEQLFNVYYVVFAITKGSQMLLEKLELKAQELREELEALQNSPQA